MKQYEIRLNKEEKAKFVDAMRIKLSVSNMTVNDLALHMKVPVKTIYNFMAGDSNSRFLAAEIAHFLKIEKKEYKSHSAFFSVLLGTSIGAILGIMAISNHQQRFEVVEKPNQFVHVVDKDKIEEEVFGVDYGGSTVTYNDWMPEMTEMEMTFYTDRGTCADGVTEARKGVCAVQKDLIGMTSIVYVSVQTTQIYAEMSQDTVDKKLKEWNETWFGNKPEIKISESKENIPDFLRK